jgi:hypothetical protein
VDVKNNRLRKLIVFAVALQILNMSIDIPTSPRDSSAKNYNFVDTYVEYIAEVMLKYENAIPETGHRQHKQVQMHKHLQIICQPVKTVQQDAVPTALRTKIYGDYSNRFAYQFIKEINPPPPKQV